MLTLLRPSTTLATGPRAFRWVLVAAEQSTAAKRRHADGAFRQRYFGGHGMDAGGKPDPLNRYVGAFARMLSCRTWDLEDGDVQHLHGVPDASHDFLHPSYCLEHLRDPREGLGNWCRVVRPGGHVPLGGRGLVREGRVAEPVQRRRQGTFTIHNAANWSPRSVNVLGLITFLATPASVGRVAVQWGFFSEALAIHAADPTLTPVAECSIEFV